MLKSLLKAEAFGDLLLTLTMIKNFAKAISLKRQDIMLLRVMLRGGLAGWITAVVRDAMMVKWLWLIFDLLLPPLGALRGFLMWLGWA